MNNISAKTLAAAVIAALLVLSCKQKEGGRYYTIDGTTQGTTFHIVFQPEVASDSSFAAVRDTINACLETVGRALAKSYLSPSGSFYKGKTIAAVNRTYAADGSWNVKVAKKVAYFYKVISENHNAQLEKLK